MIQISALKTIILFSLILRHWPRVVKPIIGILVTAHHPLKMIQLKRIRLTATTQLN